MPDSPSVALGPKLGKLAYADIGAVHVNAFRAFLRAFDALVQGSVKSRALAAPPGSPADGDAYIVAAGATGAWAGKDNQIAVWSAEIANADSNAKAPAWEFYQPKPGWSLYAEDEDAYLAYRSGAWTVRA